MLNVLQAATAALLIVLMCLFPNHGSYAVSEDFKNFIKSKLGSNQQRANFLLGPEGGTPGGSFSVTPSDFVCTSFGGFNNEAERIKWKSPEKIDYPNQYAVILLGGVQMHGTDPGIVSLASAIKEQSGINSCLIFGFSCGPSGVQPFHEEYGRRIQTLIELVHEYTGDRQLVFGPFSMGVPISSWAITNQLLAGAKQMVAYYIAISGPNGGALPCDSDDLILRELFGLPGESGADPCGKKNGYGSDSVFLKGVDTNWRLLGNDESHRLKLPVIYTAHAWKDEMIGNHIEGDQRLKEHRDVRDTADITGQLGYLKIVFPASSKASATDEQHRADLPKNHNAMLYHPKVAKMIATVLQGAILKVRDDTKEILID